jgi:DNA-binding ferritin-like protein
VPPPSEPLALLTGLLADEILLAARTRLYGWNVVGPQFVYLQQLFRAQYRTLDARVDVLGERLRELGSPVPGGLTHLLRHARLEDRPVSQPPARDMVSHLLADHQTIAAALTAALADSSSPDAATRALWTDLLGYHEHQGRLLRAFLESPADG